MPGVEESGRGEGRGCPFLPTANRRTPYPPNSLRAWAGRAGRSGSAAAGGLLGLGWERGERPKRRGRMRGAPGEAEAGAGARSPERGRAAGRWREVGELLGAHCSLSRGASDLSPTGKASVWAPPPLPESPGAAHGGLDCRRDAGEAEASRPLLIVFTWDAWNNVVNFHDKWGESSCCLRTVSFEK